MELSRRSILSMFTAAACTTAFPAIAGSPSLDAVGAAFRSAPRAVRIRAQTNLIASGLYLGEQDGAWGPGTKEGFRQLMALDIYREFARSLPADSAKAARATVYWAAPEGMD